MSTKKSYKIRISEDRVLGPMDITRIKALVLKGRILGEEPTAEEPYRQWKPFHSFSELSVLLLKKLEKDAHLTKEEPPPQNTSLINSQAPTKTIVTDEASRSLERTKTMAQSADERKNEFTGSYGIPTLLNIKAPAVKNDNPDLEKTKFFPPEVSKKVEEESATKILTPDLVAKALIPYSPAETENSDGSGEPTAPSADEYVAPDGKRRLLSRNVAAILALAILLITLWGQQEEEDNNPLNLVPRFHRFPYIEVNFPPKLGVDVDQALSADLTERGLRIIEKESPSAYIRAIREGFYPAVGKNPRNMDARALLASSYMRLSETVPRNARLFETLDKLLFPGPPQNQWTPEYVVARSEYLQMLNRFDQAQEILHAYMRVRPTPEVLFQKAKVAYERREMDTALNFISKAIPPEAVQKANPRHLLLYATLLDKKGQKDGALQNFKRLYAENKFYGPGLLGYADFQLRTGKVKEAVLLLRILINNPALLEGTQRADAFVVAAKTFETLNIMPRAMLFANAAYKTHYDRDLVEELYYRIKAKAPSTKNAYSLIVEARQKEKAKQLELAVNNYVQAVEVNRKDPTGFLLLARLYEEKGEVPEAIDRFKKALDTPARPIEAALNLARIYQSRFQLEDAKTMINQAASMGTKRDQVNYLKGMLQLKQKRQDLAMPLFELALDKGSRYVDLYIQLGDIETAKKNEKLAEFYYSIGLRYDPYNPKAMLGVALTRFHLDSPSRAITFLKDRLNAQPNSAPIMTNLAIIYLRSGDQLSGKNYLQNAIRSDARYAEAFRLLGNLTKDEGNAQNDYAVKRHSYRYALASYEMYSKLAPNDPEGFKSTADLYFDIRDLGAAAKNYYKVLELTPNYPDVRLRLAQISRNGNDPEKAMKLLDEELSVNPRSDAALVERGNIYMAKSKGLPDSSQERLNYLSLATKSFTEAARINEKNADALFGLGVVYQLQGSYDNALSLFATALKLNPLKEEVHFQRGLIYQRMNNRVKAIQAFTDFKGIVKDPELRNRADERIRELQK